MKLTESALRKIIKQELKVVVNEVNFLTGFRGLGQRGGESQTMSTLAARAAADAPTPKIELPKVLNEVVKKILTYGIDIRKIPQSQSEILSVINPMVEEFIGLGREIATSSLKTISDYITTGVPASSSASLVYSFKFKNKIGNNGTSGEYNIYIPFSRNQFASLEPSMPPVLKARESATGLGQKEIKMETQDWKTLISTYNEKTPRKAGPIV